MSTIRCLHKECLNNRKGICTATLITVERKECKDYIRAQTLLSKKQSKVYKTHGKWKNSSVDVIK